jgi:hypothetical protein
LASNIDHPEAAHPPAGKSPFHEVGMTRTVTRPCTGAAALPQWIRPQLTQLVDNATGWTRLAPRNQIRRLPHVLGARQAYLDGKPCGVGPTAGGRVRATGSTTSR